MTDEQFEQAARTYGDMVYRVACHALKNRADAEDIMQTVLLRLYEHKGEFAGEAHLKHWLLRVAVNESRKVLRTPWRRRSVPLEEWDGPAPEREEAGEVLRGVMALEAKYRLVVYLYYFEGCSVRETAEALGTKQSTVQTRLQRAREKLRVALSDRECVEGTEYVQPKFIL